MTKPTNAKPVVDKPSHLVIDRVSKKYSSDLGEIAAIGEINAEAADGRFVSIIGPSGCGKSTLLDIVAGLQRPTSGEVRIGGQHVLRPRRDMATVFQDDSTLHWRTVTENVAFGLEVAGVRRRERRERAQQMIDLVGLSGFADHRPKQLSGGMRQRVAIARALVMDPRMLLMDEPFGALDQQTRMFLGQELVRIWEKTSKSVLFVTHDIQEAAYLSDEVWVLSARPATLKEIVPINLGRPRTPDVVKSSVFHEYADHLWTLVSEEARYDPSGESQ